MAGFHLPVDITFIDVYAFTRLRYSSLSLLNWESLFAPLIEAAIHARYIGIAHRLERLSCQQRAPAGRARHDDAGILLRREFWFGIGRCGVCIPLQHAARGQHRLWN